MFFDWAVNDKVRLAMETAAYYDHTSGVSGSQLELWADLGLRQRSTLPQSNDVRIVYNNSIIKKSNGGIDSMDQVLFSTMIKEIVSRNESTYLTDTYPVWQAGASDDFTLKATIRVPKNTKITYQPGVMETLRYGFLQFLAVYVITAAIIGAVTHFIFENQIFETRIHDDSRPKTHIH